MKYTDLFPHKVHWPLLVGRSKEMRMEKSFVQEML